MGCGLGIDVDGAWCVAGNSGLSIFFHSPILSLLSSLFLSLRFCLSDWDWVLVLVLVLVLVWFDLERDLSDSLKASQCRVKHNLLWRIKEKERRLPSPSRWLQRKGRTWGERERWDILIKIIIFLKNDVAVFYWLAEDRMFTLVKYEHIYKSQTKLSCDQRLKVRNYTNKRLK